jgi:hypothetical protein
MILIGCEPVLPNATTFCQQREKGAGPLFRDEQNDSILLSRSFWTPI